MRLVVALTTVIGHGLHACNPVFERLRQEDWQEFSRLDFPGKSTRLAWAAQQDHSSKNKPKKNNIFYYLLCHNKKEPAFRKYETYKP